MSAAHRMAAHILFIIFAIIGVAASSSANSLQATVTTLTLPVGRPSEVASSLAFSQIGSADGHTTFVVAVMHPTHTGSATSSGPSATPTPSQLSPKIAPAKTLVLGPTDAVIRGVQATQSCKWAAGTRPTATCEVHSAGSTQVVSMAIPVNAVAVTLVPNLQQLLANGAATARLQPLVAVGATLLGAWLAF